MNFNITIVDIKAVLVNRIKIRQTKKKKKKEKKKETFSVLIFFLFFKVLVRQINYEIWVNNVSYCEH